MLNIIVGHRGIGKSHWLNLLKPLYGKKALFFDLDKEIEKAERQSIPSLFKKGVIFFRQKEKEVFQSLVTSLPKNKMCFISVGAGFVFKKKPLWNVIYLCRYSDKTGRVFLNRPRINPSQNPFEEYKNLYKKRNPRYLKQADEQLFRREYFKQLEDSDLLFLGFKKLTRSCFSLRLNPKEVPKDKERLKPFLQKRLHWGLRFFELNDQTADKDFVQTIRSVVPEKKILFSSQCSKKFSTVKNKKNWSWDLSLGVPPRGVHILSLHGRDKQKLKTLLKRFSSYKNHHLKLAVEILNLQELKTAYNWYREDPENRSFLPRSKEGRWLWFRQAFGSKMYLHFIKERSALKNSEEILDQPFLSSAVPFIKKRRALAGVLGHPIQFSATPAEQNSFFNKQHSIPVLPVPFKEEEMTKENLKIFKELGFIFFAVTSPLKEQAFLAGDVCDKWSQEFKSANTLIFHKGKWRAFNTDWFGLQKIKKYSGKDAVVWGGGGIRPVLKKLLPLAQFHSARTGRILNAERQSFKKRTPKTLIWAIGRKRMEQGCLKPPKHWRPVQVIDINYAEDSPGLEYAVEIQSQYSNGMEFFREQARKQREIFKKMKKL